MGMKRIITTFAALATVLTLTGCGGIGSGNIFKREAGSTQSDAARRQTETRHYLPGDDKNTTGSTFFDLFENADDPNITVEVNRYLWNATMDILSFMPVEAADPFSGVIAFGYGTPPGGGRAYKATVHVTDPALDARALNVALITRGGAPASAEATRAIEDAILTRARQMRIADGKL